MTVAWVLSLIVMVSSIGAYFEQDLALRIRLLEMEREAHQHFVGAEGDLEACEAGLREGMSGSAHAEPMTDKCVFKQLDARSKGVLMQVQTVARSGQSIALASTVYLDFGESTLRRINWRVMTPK